MTHKILAVCVLFAATAVAGCQGKVEVSAPTIQATDLASQNKTDGKYAVWIQTGGWNTTVKASGYTCSAWSFPMNLESGYASAAQGAFLSSFKNVFFTTETLKPADLKAKGYDAQIIIYQGGISTNFTPIEGFMSVRLAAAVGIDGTVAVIGPTGLASQGTAKGNGSVGGQDSMFASCGDAAQSINTAAQAGLKSFIIDAVNQAKVNALELKVKSISAQQAPPNS